MRVLLTGNEAAAYGAMLAQPAVVCAYPITPQSQIPEQLAVFSAQGQLKGKFVNVESEMAALGYVTGAAIAGARVFTATSSQGLAWMHEGLHWAAGAGLPMVLVNVNRPMGAPWNLTCEQTDSLSQRDTGWLQFYCASNQEILDTVLQAYRLSERVSLPVMVCLDGVYLSYLSETVEVPEPQEAERFLPPFRARHKIVGGGWKLFDVFPERLPPHAGDMMATRHEQHQRTQGALDQAIAIDQEFSAQFGRSHPPVEAYRLGDADIALVTMGSAVGTARDVVDRQREMGRKVGLLKIKMFRPFCRDLVRRALRNVSTAAVLDRNLSVGQGGMVWQELGWALQGMIPRERIFGFVAGLGGADINTELIAKALDYAALTRQAPTEAIWLGFSPRKEAGENNRDTVTIQ